MLFLLTDFLGQQLSAVYVDETPIPKPDVAAVPAHHIVIVDRSGSMWGVMEDTRAMVEKVMVAEEFHHADLKLTLISYSSKGDYTVHFARTPVQDVLDPKKPHVNAIRQLRATCLTSVSAALEEALKHIQASETTAITIHTDGWFNDSSPAEESRLVDAWIAKVKGKENVYVNTVAYGNYTDFNMLDRISSALSGKTVQARTVRQVYDALHDTTALLAGRCVPALKCNVESGTSFLAYHNVTQRKVNGSTRNFVVSGIGVDDETHLYKFVEVTDWQASRSTRTRLLAGPEALPAYVYARTLLGQGSVNQAKYVVAGLQDSLLLKHYKALTSEALAAFAADLERRINGEFGDCTLLPETLLQNGAGSILELLGVLNQHSRAFTVNLTETLTGYKRRGLRRLQGSWSADKQSFCPVDTRLVATDDPTVAPVSFAINNASATVNMTVVRDADLYRADVRIPAVAGQRLDLKEIRSYTVVGDGEVNIPVLSLNIARRPLWEKLVQGGWVSGSFQAGASVRIPLADLSVCPFTQTPPLPSRETVDHIIKLTVLKGFATAALGTGGPAALSWSPEQLEQLKAHNLSASLNYNPPTTTPYVDLTAAVSAGEVDTRTGFTVAIGNEVLVSPTSLYSANEYLARRWSVRVENTTEETDKDGFLKKPKLSHLRQAGASFTRKTLSARTKLSAMDALMDPLLEAFLSAGGVDTASIYSEADDLARMRDAWEAELENLYQAHIRPLVMFIGATGLVPDGWSVTRRDMTELKAAMPNIETEKKHADGVFFTTSDGVVISLFAETAYYSTELGVTRAGQIAGGAVAE